MDVRRIPIHDFYIKAGVVDLRPGELQTAIIIQRRYEGYKGHYIKYAMRNAMDIATTGCSVNVKLSADKKTMEDVRIAYGVAGPVPMRAPSAEAKGKGKPTTKAQSGNLHKWYWKTLIRVTAGEQQKISDSILL